MIEEYSLIFSRNCNLKCKYCVQYHEDINMNEDIIESFFTKVLENQFFNKEIIIYWWEPTINLKWFIRLYDVLKKIDNKLLLEDRELIIRIDTNGFFSNIIVNIIQDINNLKSIKLYIDISIDWNKKSNDLYRLLSNNESYFHILERNILLLKSKWIKVRGAVVIPYSKYDFDKNIKYLIEQLWFESLIFMPQMIMNNYKFLWNIPLNQDYLINLFNSYKNNLLLFYKFFHENQQYSKKVSNFNTRNYYNILNVPYWPCIDYDWNVYKTRVFFHWYKWKIFWNTDFNIINHSLEEIESYFLRFDYKKDIESLTKEFVWELYSINSLIINEFNKIVYIISNKIKLEWKK